MPVILSSAYIYDLRFDLSQPILNRQSSPLLPSARLHAKKSIGSIHIEAFVTKPAIITFFYIGLSL